MIKPVKRHPICFNDARHNPVVIFELNIGVEGDIVASRTDFESIRNNDEDLVESLFSKICQFVKYVYKCVADDYTHQFNNLMLLSYSVDEEQLATNFIETLKKTSPNLTEARLYCTYKDNKFTFSKHFIEENRDVVLPLSTNGYETSIDFIKPKRDSSNSTWHRLVFELAVPLDEEIFNKRKTWYANQAISTFKHFLQFAEFSINNLVHVVNNSNRVNEFSRNQGNERSLGLLDTLKQDEQVPVMLSTHGFEDRFGSAIFDVFNDYLAIKDTPGFVFKRLVREAVVLEIAYNIAHEESTHKNFVNARFILGRSKIYEIPDPVNPEQCNSIPEFDIGYEYHVLGNHDKPVVDDDFPLGSSQCVLNGVIDLSKTIP